MNKQTKLYVCSVGSGLYCSVHRNQVTYMSVEQKPYLSQGVFVYHAAVLSYVWALNETSLKTQIIYAFYLLCSRYSLFA
jgi:hypothetical protein